MATPIRIKDFPNEELTPANSDFLALDNGVTSKISRENFLKGTPLPADTADTQAIQDNAVTTPKIADGAVTADKLGTGAIYLGHKLTSATNQNTTAESMVNLESDTFIEVTIPSGGRKIKITATLVHFNGGGSAAASTMRILDGGAGGASPTTSSDVVGASSFSFAAGFRVCHSATAVIDAAAGTRRFGMSITGGTSQSVLNTGARGIVLVEVI